MSSEDPRPPFLVLPSSSGADDGGFVAIADVSAAMRTAGAMDEHRLIGGLAVMLHVLRTGVDVPIRTTADSDYGVPPHVLRDGELVEAIEAAGYQKTMGNRWERPLERARVASVDLLVPAYTSRPRGTVAVGDVVTTEVPGLATAFLRPAVQVDVRFLLTDGSALETAVLLADALSMLALKLGARTVRYEDRDATDLWRCLEVAYADGVTPESIAEAQGVQGMPAALTAQLGRGGAALPAITKDVTREEAGRRTTRIQALLQSVAGA